MAYLFTMHVCTGALKVYEDFDALRGPATFVMARGPERTVTLSHSVNAREQIEKICLQWQSEGELPKKLIVHPASAEYIKRDCDR